MKHIERITKIDQQIAALQDILKRGSHVGAGLSISLNVGAVQEDCNSSLPNLELSFETEPLLELMLKSLQQSRVFNMNFAKSDFLNLQAFLDKQPATSGKASEVVNVMWQILEAVFVVAPVLIQQSNLQGWTMDRYRKEVNLDLSAQKAAQLAKALLHVLEAIRTHDAALIADNSPSGWGMSRIRKAVD